MPSRFLGGQGPHAIAGAMNKGPAKLRRQRPLWSDSGLAAYDEPDAMGDTLGYGLNLHGDAVGEFVGHDGHTHGYVRSSAGAFAQINVHAYPSSAFWINDKGAIVGNYFAGGIQHAFVRTPGGRYLTFEPADSQGAYGLHINNKGAATGDYVDSNGLWHGFVRAKAGTLTVFDVPGAGTDPDQGTFAGATNLHGDTTGPYVDSDFILHGYVRHQSGGYDKFDVAGALDTIPYLINAKGWVVGFSDEESGAMHGFIRKPNGRIVVVDAPGAGTGPGQGTIVGDINSDGVAVGNYVDADGVSHGFLCTKTGEIIKEFDAPGAGAGGTVPYSINRGGTISGYMRDETDAGHAIIGAP
ncbi:MAG TPA: hypothetical protein VG889_19690 [Rhizomicrobium sp.]|nr:hypothetical protein [Rhizomicrobium sp.]